MPAMLDPALGDPAARVFLDAVLAGDLDTLDGAGRRLASPYEREFFAGVAASAEGRPEVLDRWVAERPEWSLPFLVRGTQGTAWAWAARGRGQAEDVGDDAFDAFFERLRHAEDDLWRAVELDPEDGAPWSSLIITARGLQIPREELRLRFDEATRRAPYLMEAHLQMLQGQCAKWGGSDEAMFDFARSVSRAAAPGSALHALLAMAHFEAWFSESRHLEDEDARRELIECADQSVFHDGWIDDAYTVIGLNIFAAVFLAAGEPARAGELARRIAERRTPMPWRYLTRPESAFRKLLKA